MRPQFYSAKISHVVGRCFSVVENFVGDSDSLFGVEVKNQGGFPGDISAQLSARGARLISSYPDQATCDNNKQQRGEPCNGLGMIVGEISKPRNDGSPLEDPASQGGAFILFGALSVIFIAVLTWR